MLNKILQEPTLNDIDIVIKCKKYPEFKKELEEIDKAYGNDLNRSIYSNLTKVEEANYFEIRKRDKLYINFYGFRMGHLNEEELNKVYLLWVMKMDEEIREHLFYLGVILPGNILSSTIIPWLVVWRLLFLLETCSKNSQSNIMLFLIKCTLYSQVF